MSASTAKVQLTSNKSERIQAPTVVLYDSPRAIEGKATAKSTRSKIMFVITSIERWRQLREELLNKTIKKKLSKGVKTERRAREVFSIARNTQASVRFYRWIFSNQLKSRQHSGTISILFKCGVRRILFRRNLRQCTTVP